MVELSTLNTDKLEDHEDEADGGDAVELDNEQRELRNNQLARDRVRRFSASQLPTIEEELVEMKKVPYANAVGSVMYSMVRMGPDLSYALSMTSRFMENSGKAHWEAVKWVLRYFKGMPTFGLRFLKRDDEQESMAGFCDANHSGDPDKRRLLIDYIFQLFGDTINWKASL
ncbi:secreted RxLR effector protein 161-like [Diospyros lotus]|uniref:secreted RxLR effector protein 161-like n=1 Tax=Diospyros lotus TaxID=55363 RepID=UPI002252E24D|nr:secreted RxLR effector protein 161-like [Diospyros lotus]